MLNLTLTFVSEKKVLPFFTKWCDLLDLSYGRKLLDMLYIDPRGVRGGIALIFFWKSVFEKHPIVHVLTFLSNYDEMSRIIIKCQMVKTDKKN